MVQVWKPTDEQTARRFWRVFADEAEMHLAAVAFVKNATDDDGRPLLTDDGAIHAAAFSIITRTRKRLESPHLWVWDGTIEDALANLMLYRQYDRRPWFDIFVELTAQLAGDGVTDDDVKEALKSLGAAYELTPRHVTTADNPLDIARAVALVAAGADVESPTVVEHLNMGAPTDV